MSWTPYAQEDSPGRRYYVGLLSAAALHGAAHQRPQEFQVVTDGQLRPITAGRARIRFFRKLRIESTPTRKMKTETGGVHVSTPEATALDLVRYIKGAGHLGHVATALAELAEKMNAERLAEVVKREDDVPGAQRLGHLLAKVGAGAVAAPLEPWIGKRRPRFVPLRPGRSSKRAARDERWRVLVNEKIEVEA